MAGLLGDVLPWIYSKGNQAKRQLNSLLDDPMGNIEQSAGQLIDNRNQLSGLLDQAFTNKQRPFQPTNEQALGQASDQVFNKLLGFAPLGMTAWHGSPTVFDKFDASKIGTGAGQAQGHGLYLAESPEVAKKYQNQPTGALYKVDLPDSAVAKMLDWDKPIAQQPENVRAALGPRAVQRDGGWFVDQGPKKSSWKFGSQAEAQSEVAAMLRSKDLTGNAMHDSLNPGADRETAALLRQLGVPGIRYGAGNGTSNFVVFPGEEGLLSILERNGAPLPK